MSASLHLMLCFATPYPLMLAVGQALCAVHTRALSRGQRGVRLCGLFKHACAHGALPAGGPTGGYEQSMEKLKSALSFLWWVVSLSTDLHTSLLAKLQLQGKRFTAGRDSARTNSRCLLQTKGWEVMQLASICQMAPLLAQVVGRVTKCLG